MKKIKFILNGLMVLTFGLMFAQCAGNNNAAPAQAPAAGATGSPNMKIAFVEIDSLLTKYNFWNDFTEELVRKEENARADVNERAKKLEAEVQEFNRKAQNNAFTQKRYEEEAMRLAKQEQKLQELQQKLANELAMEQQKNNLALRDSINSFLKEFNKTKGYDLIISNTGFDNLLYGNPIYNITNEVAEGLNQRYSPSSKK